MGNKIKKLIERINIFEVKQASLAILIKIFLLNIVLCAIAALVISALAPASLANRGFWPSVFYTISMVLDAGCITNVVTDVGEASVALIIACILIVIVGMITFTGTVIGYATSSVASAIDNAKNGNRPLRISGHTVILNWNNRSCEIINDLLFSTKKETVVVLAKENAEAIEAEINERISLTLAQNSIKNKVTVIVRSGETFSTKQLTVSCYTEVVMGQFIS